MMPIDSAWHKADSIAHPFWQRGRNGPRLFYIQLAQVGGLPHGGEALATK